MQIETGTYTGNGAGGRLITTGLDLSGSHVFVAVFKGGGWAKPYIKTSTMGASYSQPAGGGTPDNDRITALGATGFTVGSQSEVNSNAVAYYWVAMVGDGTDMHCFSYTGNGTDNRALTTPGFQPEVAAIFSTQATDTTPHWRCSGHTSSQNKRFFNGDETDGIKSLDATGFTLGTSSSVNGNTNSYSAVCWAAGAQLGVITYTGDGTDDRNVGALGFTPLFAWTQIYHPGFFGGDAVFHVDTMPSNYSIGAGGAFVVDSNTGDKVQDVQPAGLEIGTHITVNRNGSPFKAVAFGAPAAPSGPPSGSMMLLGVGR